MVFPSALPSNHFRLLLIKCIVRGIVRIAKCKFWHSCIYICDTVHKSFGGRKIFHSIIRIDDLVYMVLWHTWQYAQRLAALNFVFVIVSVCVYVYLYLSLPSENDTVAHMGACARRWAVLESREQCFLQNLPASCSMPMLVTR